MAHWYCLNSMFHSHTAKSCTLIDHLQNLETPEPLPLTPDSDTSALLCMLRSRTSSLPFALPSSQPQNVNLFSTHGRGISSSKRRSVIWPLEVASFFFEVSEQCQNKLTHREVSTGNITERLWETALPNAVLAKVFTSKSRCFKNVSRATSIVASQCSKRTKRSQPRSNPSSQMSFDSSRYRMLGQVLINITQLRKPLQRDTSFSVRMTNMNIYSPCKTLKVYKGMGSRNV